jgi:hypothetical protein
MLRFAATTTLLAGLALGATGCIISDGDSSLTLYNDSSYALYEVYLAEETDPSWGPNLLPQPLFPGDELIITDIECGTYDVLVVDDTGVECQLSGLDLCFDDDAWVIDDFTLDTCAFGG